MSTKDNKKEKNVIPLTRKSRRGISDFVPVPAKPVVEEVKGKFKRAGHFVDLQLKYDYPNDKNKQLELWDNMKNDVKTSVVSHGVERSELIEGIRLTATETKIVSSLCKLLHEKSQTLEPKDMDYYTGNGESSIAIFGGEKTPAPNLIITLFDLVKEYTGEGRSVGGKDVKNVNKALIGLSEKHFFIKYKEETTRQDGSKNIKELEMFEKLFKLINYRNIEESKDSLKVSKTEEILIQLQPIFIRQIESKFILIPNDIDKRTSIAYGSHHIPEITTRLRDYLMRALASKNYTIEIMLDRLHYLLNEKLMKNSRKSKVKKDTEKAIETMVKLRLLKNHKIEPSKGTGEPKIIFTINKDFK